MRSNVLRFHGAMLVNTWDTSASLLFLADKVARFLFEFHADDYKGLGLPVTVIPPYASSGAIHKLLKTPHVCI